MEQNNICNSAKLVIAFLLSFATVFMSFAQTFFRVNWEKTYELSQNEKVYSIIPATDGNFILAGETSSSSSPGQKILILKVTPGGDLIWQKSYGGTADCKFVALTKSEDGGLVILGTKKLNASNPSVLIIKTDKDGNLIRESSAGGGDMEFITDLSLTADNGVILCGAKQIKGNTDTDGWIIKLNKKGSVESQILYGPKYINDEFSSVEPDGTGGFYLAGFTSEKMGGDKIPYLMRIDFRGGKIWEKSYPEFPGAVPETVFRNSEGLIILLANVFSKNGDFSHVEKISFDTNGQLINSYSVKQRLNIKKNSFVCDESEQLTFLSVQNDDPSTFSDKFIIKLNKSLNPIWIKPLETENTVIKAVHAIDNYNLISAGCSGLSLSKLDASAFSFRDYSGKLIDSYVNQKLISDAGMNMNEPVKDFAARIGKAKFDAYLEQFSSDAIKDLRLIPESLASNASTGKDSRASLVLPALDKSGSNSDISFQGKYYALLIAVEDYIDPGINDLDKPVKDAQKLYDVLLSDYMFEKTNITFLKNPTREKIISTLDNLEKQVTKTDNLLIFYAGHGFWSETTQKGFWLPSDASKQNTSNWIANSSVSDYIRSIPAKHTLLIADACFSGSIFKTRAAFGSQDMSARKLYELPSRKAMTSGTLTEVPDKSVFIEFLVKRLYENQDQYLPSEQLFFSFKPAVLNNTESIPQYGVVGSAGDEGGDFIFIKRKK